MRLYYFDLFCSHMYNVLPLPSTTNLVKLPITQFPGNNKIQLGAILGDLSLWLSRFSRLSLFEIEIEAELTEANHSEPKYVSALTQSPHIPSGSLAFSRSPCVRITPALVSREWLGVSQSRGK